jgi:hypothetical protein
MTEINFTPIGKIPGQYIFVHKEDLQFLHSTIHSDTIKCIAIDFETLQISVPVIINRLFEICPYDLIDSDLEREEVMKTLFWILPQRTIDRLRNTFNKIRRK